MAGRTGLPSVPVVAVWFDELHAGTLDRVPHTREEMDLVRLLSRLSGRISEQGGARSHWWVPTPDGDVSEGGSKGTEPGASPLVPRDLRMQSWETADDDMGSRLPVRTGSC